MARTAEQQKALERKADASVFVGALAGGAIIDCDWRVTGWVLLVISVACLFQRISNLTR